MAVPLEKIYYTAMRKYGMRLLAGKDGIWNAISWIHTVEDIRLVDFLKGHELVIITGLKTGGRQDLIEITKEIFRRKASGIVFNTGPFIEEVPKEIIWFGDENDFPIFVLPWEVHLVEFNREFCNLILQSEHESQNLCSAFRSAIFSPADTQLYLPVLQDEGIPPDEKYCMIKFMPVLVDGSKDDDNTKFFYDLRQHCEKILNMTQKTFVIFRHESFLTIVLPGANREHVQTIIDEIVRFRTWQNKAVTLYFAVSRYRLPISRLSEYFDTLSMLCRMGVNDGRAVWFWEDLGVLSLLLSIRDEEEMKEYVKRTIGELESYDRENGSQYCKILRTYIEADGDMNAVARQCFLHRNTIAYHLKKISEMLGCDLYSISDRAQFYIAFRLKEIGV